MIEQIFAYDENNFHDCQSDFRGKHNQEYFAGKYRIEDSSFVDVRADKKMVGALSIIRLQSQSRMHFQRTWHHIQEDATDVTVLWFIKRGCMQVTYQNSNSIACAGKFGIINTLSPFIVECRTDEASVFEVLHVLAPSHIFRRYCADEINVGFHTASDKREIVLAEQLFSEVFRDEGQLSHVAEQALMESALTLLSEGIKRCEGLLLDRPSLPQARFQDVLRHIEIHLVDPDLSADSVAQSCGISRRYLSHLLNKNNTTFSDLLWSSRLKAAHDWLSNQAGNNISIAEVAFRTGFKSAGHFSRKFKQAYQVNPREFRSRQVANAALLK